MSTFALQRRVSDKNPRAATVPGESLQRQVGTAQAEGRHPEPTRGTATARGARTGDGQQTVHAGSSVSQQHVPFTGRLVGRKMVLRCDFRLVAYRQSKEGVLLLQSGGVTSVQGKSSWVSEG